MKKSLVVYPLKETFFKNESFQKADGSFAEFEIYQLDDHNSNTKNNLFCLTAKETEKSKGDRFGYEFKASSYVSPEYTMGQLREKIRKILAVKYLDREKGVPHLTHDSLLARVSYCKEEGIVLEADGRKVTKEEFWEMISSYEGWEIELKVK
jgi:hypothetical protein